MASKNGIYFFEKDGVKTKELSIDIEVIRLLTQCFSNLSSRNDIGVIVNTLSSGGVLKDLNEKINCIPPADPTVCTGPIGTTDDVKEFDKATSSTSGSASDANGLKHDEPADSQGSTDVAGSAGTSKEVSPPVGSSGLTEATNDGLHPTGTNVDIPAESTVTGPSCNNEHQQFLNIMQQVFSKNNGSFGDIMAMMLHTAKR